ncbi:hypothetical protein [Krasilnikoviella flava]|uniref:Uncharacterized protein n=1 Tax=Krasilnikoviella flava TaxID=526729 RepID=A0A1T5LSQ9_9MICO|nr:hypothetical protein [Krasilnikoviella flava]SKC79037.1 hypothetical protein SAMN04324258_3884 [Krasilnikoviella flava]
MDLPGASRDDLAAPLVTDYFAAPTDAVAATVVHQEAGPSVLARGSGRPLFDTVRLPAVEPFVMLGRLAEALCARPYAEVTAHPRHGALVDGADEGPWVVTVSDELASALAAAAPERLAAVARDWATTGTAAAPDRLAPAFVALGELAGRAGQVRHALYCWTRLTPLGPAAVAAGPPSGGRVRTSRPA